MAEKQQRLVLAIIDFLNQSMADGTVKQDDREGLEVAVQCIGEAFGVDPNDKAQSERLSIKPANLTSLFDLFLKTRDRMSGGASVPSPSGSSSYTADKTPSAPSGKDIEEAESLKGKGNSLMSAKKYDEAIAAYGQAIAKNPTNAVYYSNRAAAYSSKGDHPSAIVDAEKAIDIDSKFAKAYHRLGHAHYSLGDYTEAASAFKRGLEIDPSNTSLKTGLQNAEARSDTPTSRDSPTVAETPASAPGGMGGLGDMLSAFGGGGGGGAGGGMPNLASMMQNPMFMQMAQNMMQNGGMEEIMRNPALQNLASRAQSGSMPSMSELMSDPAIRDLAGRFGAGGAPGGSPASSQ